MRQGRLPGCDAGIEEQPVAGYMPAESAMGRCDGPLRVHAWRKRQSGYPAWRSCISRKRETACASHPARRRGWRAFREEEEKIAKRMDVSQERCFARRGRNEKDGYSASGVGCCKKKEGMRGRRIFRGRDDALQKARRFCPSKSALCKKGRTLSGIKYSMRRERETKRRADIP